MLKYILLALPVLILASCTTTPSNPSGTGATSSTTSMTIPSPTFGSGNHTLTLFADFQCPACIAFNKALAPVFEDYASRGLLKITYKQFPLTSIHRNAERDSLAGLCAAEQWAYMTYKKALYDLEDGKKWASVSDADRVKAGEGLLDTAKLEACLKEDRYLAQVRAEMKEGDTLGVTGTPTVLFDGRKLDNSIFRDTAALKKVMDNLLGVTAAPASTGTGIVTP